MAETIRYIRTNIFNPISRDEFNFYKDYVITIKEGKFCSIIPFTEHDGSFEDYSHAIALPGLIDLHTHLSQYYIKGMYEPSLLSWLNRFVYPEERRSHNPDYAQKLSYDFFNALISKGTTFAVIYTAPFREAADAAFEVAEELKLKAKIGLTLMDRNSPPCLQQDTDYALRHSIELEEKHREPKLGHIFTPRFALSCSSELMNEIGKYASKHGSFIQTHLSENPDEVREAKRLFKAENYTQIYADTGILGPNTLLAHAIHLDDKEIITIKERESKLIHCPDSNFFLKSGEFALNKLKQAGLPIGLGSDVAAGSTLDMLYHAKMMNYRQTIDAVPLSEMLYSITLGNAKILNLDNELGSIDSGKDADLVLYHSLEPLNIEAETLSRLFFCSPDFSVEQVIIDGKDRIDAKF